MESAGIVYSWWQGDLMVTLQPVPGLLTTRMDDPTVLGDVLGTSIREVEELMAGGDVPYVGYLNGEVAAWGWSASRRAQVGELGIEFEIPDGNRYLWDFVTLPAFRGHGIYPRLLQFILAAEQAEADRFWIGHAPDNDASARGIVKAGFHRVAEVWILEGRPAIAPDNDPAAKPGRAVLAARLMGLPLLAELGPIRSA